MNEQPSSRRRLIMWAIMVATITWTMMYRLGVGGGDLPEFIYVNF